MFCRLSQRDAPLASIDMDWADVISVRSRKPPRSAMSRDEMPWPPLVVSTERPSLNQSWQLARTLVRCHIVKPMAD